MLGLEIRADRHAERPGSQFDDVVMMLLQLQEKPPAGQSTVVTGCRDDAGNVEVVGQLHVVAGSSSQGDPFDHFAFVHGAKLVSHGIYRFG